MKKALWAGVVGLLGICLTVAVVGAAAQMKSVAVKETALRSSPMPFGQIIEMLRYGDRVAVDEEANGWLRVHGKSGQGWVHVSALTAKRVELRAGDDDVSAVASSEELALAGKGFNRQVEASFKDRNRQMDYASVDRMEAMTIQPSALQEFLRKGGLAEWGGAANAQ